MLNEIHVEGVIAARWHYGDAEFLPIAVYSDPGRGGRHGDERLLETDALVAGQHRLARPDHAIPLPYDCRHVADLVTTCLAFPQRTAQVREGGFEELCDEMRLQFARFQTLHVQADAFDGAGIHHVVRQRAVGQ